MHVTQEKRPGSRIGLSFVIPADQVKRGYDKTLRQISQQADIPGFRKGKAPLAMLIRTVGRERVRAAALEDLLETTLKQALKDAKIDPLTPFEVDGGSEALLEHYNPEVELHFSGSVEVMPEVNLNPYTGLTVEAKREDVDANEVANTLRRYQEERATLIPVTDRPVQLGDVAIIDFTATYEDGSPVEGSTSHDFQLDMNPENFYPGFVEGVVGMVVDDIKEVVVTIPEDYYDPTVAGKNLKFRVTLNDIKAKELPELDDAFAQSISQFATLTELQDFLHNRAERNALLRCQRNAEDALMDAIVKDLEIDLPASMVEQETINMVSNSLSYLEENQGISRDDLMAATKENWPQLSEKVKPEAIERLRRSFAMGELIKREKIEVGQTELEVALGEFMDRYQGDISKINVEETAKGIYRRLLTDKAVRWLVQQSQITWVDQDGNPVEAPQFTPPVPVAASTDVTDLVTEGIVEAEFGGDPDSTPEMTLDATAVVETDVVADPATDPA